MIQTNLTKPDIKVKAAATNKPEFSLDAKALGSFQAQHIYLIGTEQGVGVNMAGDMASSAGDIFIQADGTISLKDVNANETLTVTAKQGDIKLTTGSQYGEHVTLNAANAIDISQNNLLAARQSIVIDSLILEQQGQITAGLERDNTRNNAGILHITAQTVNNQGNLQSTKHLELQARDKLNNQDGTIIAINTASITGKDVDNTDGSIEANVLQLKSEGNFINDTTDSSNRNTGLIRAFDSEADSLSITVSGTFRNQGTIQSNAERLDIRGSIIQ